MSTTLRDYGRHSEKHGDIAYYYAFPIRFYFGQHMIAPDDVLSWCQENAQGYYKISCYTHENSKRVSPRSRDFAEKFVYVDKIYLSDERDAIAIKLMFDVREERIKRPKLKALRRRQNLKKVKTVAA
jgi:hypothetical protein